MRTEMNSLRSIANTKAGIIIAFLGTFALIYNPLTKFPYTFIVIIAVLLLVTFMQDGNLKNLNFKTLDGKAILTILVCYICLELTADFIFQPMATWIFKEPADYSMFNFIKGNQPAYFKYLLYMWISAAIGEELFFRAFAFSQLGKLLPAYPYLTLFASAVLFCLPHLYQGLSGLFMTFIFGLAFGMIYLKYKNIWINIIVHGLIDTLFLTLSYMGLMSFYA